MTHHASPFTHGQHVTIARHDLRAYIGRHGTIYSTSESNAGQTTHYVQFPAGGGLFCHVSDLEPYDQTPADLRNAMRARLEAHGFFNADTHDDHRQAYIRDDAEVCDECRANGPQSTCDCRREPEIEEWLTTPTEQAPVSLDDVVLLITKNTTDEEIDRDGQIVKTDHDGQYTVRQILAALDDPRDEYHLLRHRLNAGYGRTRP